MMTVRFTKRKDGRAVLQCIRKDGSSTWQRQDAERALFFPLHDLTHFAVETELGFRSGFFGLLAAGWDIADTNGKGTRGPLPNEALEVEYLVGAFSAERAGDSESIADEFYQHASAFAQSKGLPPPRQLTNADLAKVRSRITDLCGQWHALPSGETLELTFPISNRE